MQTQEKDHKIFIYYRVSTDLQDIKMQKNNVSKYLSKEGDNYEVIDVFADKGISGATKERPAFQKMLERLNEVDGIMVYNWDRMSRDEEFATNLMYELRKKGIFVLESDTGQKYNFKEAYHRMITFIKSQEAERERKRHLRRTKDGIATFIDKHNRWGPSKKYGFTSNGKPLNKEKFWYFYETYRLANVSKSAISRILGLSRPTLYKRLDEELERYKKIESEVEEKYDLK